jgi:hypothetical protein
MLSGLGICDVGDGLARHQSVGTLPHARSQEMASTLVHLAAELGQGNPGQP